MKPISKSHLHFHSSNKTENFKHTLFKPYHNFVSGALKMIDEKTWEFTIPFIFLTHVNSTLRTQISQIGFQASCLEGPIEEEIIFRGLIQDVALKRIPELLADYHLIDKSYVPSKETRIECASLLFALAHVLNYEKMPVYYVAIQTLGAYGLGHFFGTVKESEEGIMGSIGAHVANNSIVYVGVHLLEMALNPKAAAAASYKIHSWIQAFLSKFKL